MAVQFSTAVRDAQANAIETTIGTAPIVTTRAAVIIGGRSGTYNSAKASREMSRRAQSRSRGRGRSGSTRDAARRAGSKARGRARAAATRDVAKSAATQTTQAQQTQARTQRQATRAELQLDLTRETQWPKRRLSTLSSGARHSR